MLRVATAASSSDSVRSDRCSPPCPRRRSSAGTGRASRRSVGMLRSLRIENLVVIRQAELGLDPGLNALTGQTGAGKTIFAQAVGLRLGGRGDAGAIGPAGEEGYVEAG